MTMPDTIERTDVDIDFAAISAMADMWSILVHNDDVTTFDDVINALVELFDHTTESADAVAWSVHRTGKGVAATRSKDEATKGVAQLHARKIQASMEPA